ncbi:MAG TPA: nitroreductase family deazaflavin-dependent oxidoreductase [Solirubrobacteraceae bacterium]|jgi:deazaflavin-dependent oxidoreductase (nitroreductase family)|nr:nitroreductase family deazaflavin-dependent oxidoreductase [Solirubrobacteraceae bacterium]
MAAPPAFPPPGSLRAKLVNTMGSLNVVAYRLSGGRLGGRMQQLPLLLLHHVGRKSGQTRVAPLLYLQDGEDLVIVGSRGGSDAPPAWWLNLQAQPRATVEIRGARRDVVARQATPEEKARLWPELVRGYSHYDAYQQRTSREIPVIILSPA